MDNLMKVLLCVQQMTKKKKAGKPLEKWSKEG